MFIYNTEIRFCLDLSLNIPIQTHQRLYMTTAIAVVGGRVDRSRSTCFTPGGTLLTQRSSFNSMFNTGIVSLVERGGNTF